MSKLGIPFDLTNFLLNRDKSMFYIRLKGVQNKKYKLYDLCKDTKITERQSILILTGLRYYKLIDFKYDTVFHSYVPVFTERGLRIRSLLIKMSKLLVELNIWGDGNVKSFRQSTHRN